MIVGIIAHQPVHLLVYLKPMHPLTRSIDCFVLAQFRKKLSSQFLFQFTRLGQPSPYYPAQLLLPQRNEVIAYPFPRPWLHLIAALSLSLFIYAQPIIMKSLLLSPSFPAPQLCINIPSPPPRTMYSKFHRQFYRPPVIYRPPVALPVILINFNCCCIVEGRSGSKGKYCARDGPIQLSLFELPTATFAAGQIIRSTAAASSIKLL